MGRVVEALRREIAARCRAVISAWDRFWFTPGDPTLLGFIRILTGTMLVYTHAVWGLELEAFFGPEGWQPPNLVEFIQQDRYTWSFWWYVSPEYMWPVHWASLTILVLFTLGAGTRVTSILSFIIAVSYIHRVPAAQFGLDQINILLTLYLAIGPSGAALSIDRLITRYRQSRGALSPGRLSHPLPQRKYVTATLATRLLQVHMCIIYLFAGLSKLQGNSWWNGEAMWQALSNLEYQSADMTWLAHHPKIINLMTHVTIAWEVSFIFLIWRPTLRPIILCVGVLLHFGIGAWMGMWTFGLIMLVGCASFLSVSLVKRLFEFAFAGREVSVLFDSTAIGARRFARWAKVFDVAGRVELVDTHGTNPSRIHRELKHKSCEGAVFTIYRDHVQEGPAALRVLAKTRPMLWPVWPLLWLPGSDSLFRAYFGPGAKSPKQPERSAISTAQRQVGT